MTLKFSDFNSSIDRLHSPMETMVKTCVVYQISFNNQVGFDALAA